MTDSYPTPAQDFEEAASGRLGPSGLISAPIEVAGSGHVEALGPYRVVGTLGRGGMGIVYDVEHHESGARYALKTIETRFLELPDSNAGRRFHQEIELLERLDHPGIVRLFDYGFVRHPMGYDMAFFVMERLDGETLDERIAGERWMSAEEAVALALAVTESLGYLEQNGILHRDVKPANIFLEASGRIVLMDFGLARSREFTRLTQAGHVIGTLAYMSPEALIAAECDGRTDVFALGAVLFEAMTGNQPFLTRDPTEHVKEIRGGPIWPTPLPDVLIVHHTVALVDTMLAADITRRPSAPEVARQARWILERSNDTGPVDVAQPGQPTPTASFLVATMDPLQSASDRFAIADAPVGPLADPVVATAASPSAYASAVGTPARNGPSWGTAVFVSAVFAGLAFGAGLSVGRTTAPPVTKVVEVEVPIEVPAPPPPPPVEPPAPRFTEADAAYRFGAASFDRGDLDAADDALGQALSMNPVHPEATYLLARTKLATSKTAEAKQLFLQYKLLRPKAPEVKQIDELLEKGL